MGNLFDSLTVGQICDIGAFLGVAWADHFTDYAYAVEFEFCNWMAQS